MTASSAAAPDRQGAEVRDEQVAVGWGDSAEGTVDAERMGLVQQVVQDCARDDGDRTVQVDQAALIRIRRHLIGTPNVGRHDPGVRVLLQHRAAMRQDGAVAVHVGTLASGLARWATWWTLAAVGRPDLRPMNWPMPGSVAIKVITRTRQAGRLGRSAALGGSGARTMTTLVHHMRDYGIRYGLQPYARGGSPANAIILKLL